MKSVLTHPPIYWDKEVAFDLLALNWAVSFDTQDVRDEIAAYYQSPEVIHVNSGETLWPNLLLVKRNRGWIVVVEGTRQASQLSLYILDSGVVEWGVVPGKVHSAFAHLAEPIVRLLIPALSPPWDDGFYFTGHSMGGAVAQLLASHFIEHQHRKVPGIFTFGAPRVGSPEYARNLRVPHVRCELLGDPVPRFPFEKPTFIPVPLPAAIVPQEFRHHGNVTNLGEDGQVHPAIGRRLDDTSHLIMAAITDWKNGNVATTHVQSSYIKAVWRSMDTRQRARKWQMRGLLESLGVTFE